MLDPSLNGRGNESQVLLQAILGLGGRDHEQDVDAGESLNRGCTVCVPGNGHVLGPAGSTASVPDEEACLKAPFAQHLCDRAADLSSGSRHGDQRLVHCTHSPVLGAVTTARSAALFLRRRIQASTNMT